MGKSKVKQATIRIDLRVSVENESKFRKHARKVLKAAKWMDKQTRREILRLARTQPEVMLPEVIDTWSLTQRIPGIAESAASIELLSEDAPPNFFELFRYLDTDGIFSPLVAESLWQATTLLRDSIQDDLIMLDHESDFNDTFVISMLPPLARCMKPEWVQKFAFAFDYIAEDIRQGQIPIPCCRAEEVALHLAIEVAKDNHFFGDAAGENTTDWATVQDDLLQDSDYEMMFDPKWDGIDDPESEVNQFLGIGDMHPREWFTPFGNVEPRYGPPHWRQRVE